MKFSIRDLFSQPVKSCSFCWRQTDQLVEGRGENRTGGVFICRQCAELAIAIFEKQYGDPPTSSALTQNSPSRNP
jgi:hypothetical protein